MTKIWFYIACLACFMIACLDNKQAEVKGVTTIDVAGAMENPVELKLSELVKDVRYIPLETTDSCLIGNHPNLLLLNHQIAVYTNKDCLLFNKSNGKFICKVGHRGDDPEAYTSPQPIYNGVDGLLYFRRSPAAMQKYDLQGNYKGKIELPSTPASPSDVLFTDSFNVGFYNSLAQQYNARLLVFFDNNGTEIDTIPALSPVLPEKKMADIANISIMKRGLAGFLLTHFKDGGVSAGISGIPFLWEQDGLVRLKENFNDTVYTVTREKLIPSIVFSTGKWSWGPEARTDPEDSESRLLMTTVFETDQFVFFQCTRSAYSDKPIVYNGVYDRNTGLTRICEEDKNFTDDLTNFLPFSPKTCSAKGEFGSIIGSDKIMEWFEEHPEEVKNEKIAALKSITEESNPVVAITVPKE
ncbi:DUF4934 domain-containing protein [Massilibacteroides sp.]|uniref:DUF4934 domain-containing protein n=1 Tax=Massilibacteroides sp. TaxID=2034766 RepID=UPI00263441DC|nr:DUF4934 domain-containing protein [Massilibacteroides sp.]MDD4513957.1 DUF4934 domain-containing protein [Massilibacteroides sp.]